MSNPNTTQHKTQEQLVKQLKVLNFWVRLFGIIVVTMLLIVGFLVFQVVRFVNDTNNRIEEFQQTAAEQLDVQKQICEGEGGFNDLIRNNTRLCE